MAWRLPYNASPLSHFRDAAALSQNETHSGCTSDNCAADGNDCPAQDAICKGCGSWYCQRRQVCLT